MTERSRGWVLALTLAMFPSATTTAANLPPGFEDSIVVQISTPRSFAQFDFAPDGSIFIADKSGRVWRFLDGVLIPHATLPVSDLGERGINGVAVDPDFESNQHLWLYYSTLEPHRNRLSRFTVADFMLTDEWVAIDGPPVSDTDHNAGGLRFAADGTLFVSTGDDKQGSVVSRDPFDLRGKILRIRRDGSGAPGNPFSEGVAGDSRVWAWGLRNPYRLALQPGSENPFIADVGAARWEELDLGFPGADFGWAEVEGPEPRGVVDTVYPIHAYAHEGMGAAIIGGDFAGAGDLRPGYEGNYFYHELVQRRLMRVVLDENNNVAEVETFATDFGPATDLKFGSDGALYYVCRSCGPTALRKIAWVGVANDAPQAVIEVTPDTSGAAPLSVSLDAANSSDPEGATLSYAWDLGDGTLSEQAALDHTFAEGVHDLSLVVDDGSGASDEASVRIVSGNHRPTATIVEPVDETSYVGGQIVELVGSGDDIEEGALGCDRYTWQVVLHRSGSSWPVLGPSQGRCGESFTVPDDRYPDADQFYRVLLAVDDSGVPLGPAGQLAAGHAVELRPATAALRIESTPKAGFQVLLDGLSQTTPLESESVVAVRRTLATPAQQTDDAGRLYAWIGWSDGGEIEREVSAQPGGTTVTAQFGCLPAEVRQLTADLGPEGLTLSWLAPEGDCGVAPPERYRIYATTDPAPAAAPGVFPHDPSYELIGTSSVERAVLPLPATTLYFLVVDSGPEGLNGRSGHYDF